MSRMTHKKNCFVPDTNHSPIEEHYMNFHNWQHLQYAAWFSFWLNIYYDLA
jgi:hypothetical protein